MRAASHAHNQRTLGRRQVAQLAVGEAERLYRTYTIRYSTFVMRAIAHFVIFAVFDMLVLESCR